MAASEAARRTSGPDECSAATSATSKPRVERRERRRRDDARRDLPRIAFELRNFAAAVPVVVAFGLARGSLASGATAWIAALSLCSVGILIRAWATVHCRYAQGFRKTLATTGPYRWVRNPLYLGNLAILAAGLAASEQLWLVPLGAAWALAVYDRAVRHEERRLESRYGAPYAAYRAQTPRWWPRPPRPFWPEGPAPFARCLLLQSRAFLLLAPFLLRESHVMRLLRIG